MPAAPRATDLHRLTPLAIGLQAPTAFNWAGWAEGFLLSCGGRTVAVVQAHRMDDAAADVAADVAADGVALGPHGDATRPHCLALCGAPSMPQTPPDRILCVAPADASGQGQGAAALELHLWGDLQALDAAAPILEHGVGLLRNSWRQHRHLEDAVRKSQELAARLDWIEQGLNFAREVVWEIDVRSRTFRYSRFTSQLTTVDGKQADISSFDSLLDSIHPEDRRRTLDALDDYVKGTASEFYVEYRQRIQGGHWIWSRSRGRAVQWDDAGRPSRIHGTAVGISQLKSLERSLRDSIESRTQFLATMSHEFRTPLNGIVGASQLALLEEDLPAVRHHLTMVHSASRHLLGLINSVLDYSRLDAQALTLDVKPLSVRRLLAELRLAFSASAEQRGLALDLSWDPALPLAVQGDEMRLHQILGNLVANALRFTHRGSVEVRVSVLDGPVQTVGSPAEETADEVRLAFEVHDTGIGMTQEQIDRLFKPYSQADATIARRYGGTGLGLSICSQLVKLMGGTLQVRSQLGVGSVFAFELSMPQVSADSIPAGAALADSMLGSPHGVGAVSPATASVRLAQIFEHARRDLSGYRILVVDDNRMNLTVLERFLERAGVHCVSADRPSKALEWLGREPVDAVLMDLYMPEMDGTEAARHLRRMPALQSTPILAVSASVTQQEHALCLQAGMDDFVAKPIDPLQLFDALRRHIGARRQATHGGPAAPAAPAASAEPAD